MAKSGESELHKSLKAKILEAALADGLDAKAESSGSGWRADVAVRSDIGTIAFEVQKTPQSLAATIKRQMRYRASGVIGCWLFLNPVHHLNDERPDLPLFYVPADSENGNLVSLGDRRAVTLDRFVPAFARGLVRFCNRAVSSWQQEVTITFYRMKCWNCGFENHPYFLDDSFTAACGARAHPDESLWSSNRSEVSPEIVEAVMEYVAMEDSEGLIVPPVKERFSKTVGHSYLSFGCLRCDSIFGDWYLRDAELEAMYGYGVIASTKVNITLPKRTTVNLPHWCYPDTGDFCEPDPPTPS